MARVSNCILALPLLSEAPPAYRKASGWELRKRESGRKREIRQIGKGWSLGAPSHVDPFRAFASLRAFAVPGRDLSESERLPAASPRPPATGLYRESTSLP